jgi:hypothetical protein
MSGVGVPDEPHDDTTYNGIDLRKGTIKFYIESVEYLLSLMRERIREIDKIPLMRLISNEQKRSMDIPLELEKGQRRLKWLKDIIGTTGEDHFSYYIPSITHFQARYFKTAGIIYVNSIKLERSSLSDDSSIPQQAIQAIDDKIKDFEDKLSIGIFRPATPLPYLIAEFSEPAPIRAKLTEKKTITENRGHTGQSPSALEIHDPELHNRCMDLYNQFASDGQLDRLDTVITEATRILEQRIRIATNAPAEIVGIKLASYAFGGDKPRLVVSEIESEQEGAHLLFRGVFGFIRNSAHHKLLGEIVVLPI